MSVGAKCFMSFSSNGRYWVVLVISLVNLFFSEKRGFFHGRPTPPPPAKKSASDLICAEKNTIYAKRSVHNLSPPPQKETDLCLFPQSTYAWVAVYFFLICIKEKGITCVLFTQVTAKKKYVSSTFFWFVGLHKKKTKNVHGIQPKKSMQITSFFVWAVNANKSILNQSSLLWGPRGS